MNLSIANDNSLTFDLHERIQLLYTDFIYNYNPLIIF